MAYSIDNKTALLYGLFNWQQNGQQKGLIIWLLQLATNRPYSMADSVGNKTALSYGLFSWQQNGFIIWLIQLATKRPYYMAYSIGNITAFRVRIG